ncbi:chemotaxis protein CheC [Halalkalibacillus halophilus]|uniref:chemotaxis protein CheC n=1 Tax=Halalkalibacillus halophilus TaxID=392827 RepID=UPI00040F4420|nr:chemotaxis protein CheC [Halalkalibacillus halophilus]
MSHQELNNIQLDVLKEIGNIGAGNAATSLSQLLNRSVQMTVPVVNIVSFDEMMEEVGGSDDMKAAVFVRVDGDVPGSMFFIIAPEEADLFIQMMLDSPSASLESHDEMAASAFLELGNILTGSYLRALSDFTQLEVIQSVPTVAIDMVGAMLTQGLIEISTETDQAIMIETVLHDIEGLEREMTGHFFLLPNPTSYETIFKSLGVQSND